MVQKTKPSRLSLEKAAQAWCEPETSHITMIPELAEAFAVILDKESKVVLEPEATPMG